MKLKVSFEVQPKEQAEIKDEQFSMAFIIPS